MNVEGFCFLTCVSCGTRFAIQESLWEVSKQNKKAFHCPNGHTLAYTGKNNDDEIEELKKRVTELEAELRDKEIELRQVSGELMKFRQEKAEKSLLQRMGITK